MAEQRALIPVERIEQAIYLVRGQKVMFDFDLAALYGVATKALIQAVKRNRERFPADFMFQLSKREMEVTFCDLQSRRQNGPEEASIRLLGAGCGYAFKCAQQ